jgi:hypothetical protein
MSKVYKPRVKRPAPEPTKALAPVLARVGDPFVASDGTLVMPEYPEDYFPRVKSDTKIDPVTYRSKRRRNVNELPATPNVMNVVGAVMLYTLYGVGDREIAQALKCSVMDIDEIRGHSAYTEFFELLSAEVISAESDSLTHRLAAYAHGALDTIAHVSRNGKAESNRLRASIDIMDRGGFAPKQVAERQISLKNVLRIQVLDDGTKMKNLDIELSTETGDFNGDSAEQSIPVNGGSTIHDAES